MKMKKKKKVRKWWLWCTPYYTWCNECDILLETTEKLLLVYKLCIQKHAHVHVPASLEVGYTPDGWQGELHDRLMFCTVVGNR